MVSWLVSGTSALYPMHVRKTCTFAVDPIPPIYSRSPRIVSLRDIKISFDTTNLFFLVLLRLFLSQEEDLLLLELNWKKIERKRIVDEKNFGRIGSCQTFPSPFVRDFFAVLESTGISFRRRHRFSLIRPVRIRVTDNGRVVGNRQDPRDPASRKTVSRTDDRNGEERPARESAHTADWKLMRMRERTRSNCGRRYPSTLVAKVEGGETTQGLGTTRHWWRLWLLAHGYSVCARMCRDQRRRLLSSPRFGTSLADLPLFKIGKVVERGCPSPYLSIPLSMISMILMEIGGTLNDHAPSAWRLCPGLLCNLQVYFLFLTYNSLDKFFFCWLIFCWLCWIN